MLAFDVRASARKRRLADVRVKHGVCRATRWRHAGLIALGALLWTVQLVAAPAHQVGAIRVDRPWANPSAPGMVMGAAYMTITNTGKAPDELVGASSPIAAKTDLHSTTRASGLACHADRSSRAPAAGDGVSSDADVSPGGDYYCERSGREGNRSVWQAAPRAPLIGPRFSARPTTEQKARAPRGRRPTSRTATHRAHRHRRPKSSGSRRCIEVSQRRCGRRRLRRR